MIYLMCVTCKAKLSMIIRYRGDDQIWYDYQHRAQEDFVDQGRYFLTPQGDYILNRGDKANLKRHPDLARSHGCCGAPDSDVPNLICATCHAELGREVSDCIYPHFLRLSASQVVEIADQWDIFGEVQKLERQRERGERGEQREQRESERLDELLLQLHQLILYSSPEDVQVYVNQQLKPALSHMIR